MDSFEKIVMLLAIATTLGYSVVKNIEQDRELKIIVDSIVALHTSDDGTVYGASR